MKMKIGFLSHSDMSIYFFRLPIMRALKERGHKVYAIMPKGAYYSKVASEFECVSYDIAGASINPFRVGKNALSLAKALAPLHLDVLQSAAHKSNIFGTMAAQMIGIKYKFCLVEGMGSAYTSDGFLAKILRFVIENLYKSQLKNANGCIFVNEHDKNYFIKKGLIEKKKASVIKSVGVNCYDFAPRRDALPSELKRLEGKKIVLMMGRALKDKGVAEFYEAAKIVMSDEDFASTCAFVFVGSAVGGKKGFNDAYLKNSPFVTHIKWSDKPKELINACYLFALPSYREGFPRTILEAMALAKPCVASKCVGCDEAVIHERTGLLCRMKDPADLAKKIKTLLKDEHLASIYGTNARNIALDNYDEKIITRHYIEFYETFLKEI